MKLTLLIATMTLAPAAEQAPLNLPGVVELEVIHDSGRGVPVRTVLANVLPRLEQSLDEAYSQAAEQKVRDLPAVLKPPYAPTRMQVGRFTSRPRTDPHVSVRMPSPFFVIGSDPFSRAWLQRNHATLVQLRAVGFLVQASSEADLAGALKAAGGLQIAPVAGDVIAQTYGLALYPALITQRTVEQ